MYRLQECGLRWLLCVDRGWPIEKYQRTFRCFCQKEKFILTCCHRIPIDATVDQYPSIGEAMFAYFESSK